MVQPGDIWLDGKRVPELKHSDRVRGQQQIRQMCLRVFKGLHIWSTSTVGTMNFPGRSYAVSAATDARFTSQSASCTRICLRNRQISQRTVLRGGCGFRASSNYRKHHGGDRGDRLCIQHRCTGQINDPATPYFQPPASMCGRESKKDKEENCITWKKDLPDRGGCYVPYGQTVRFETLRVDKRSLWTETSYVEERYLP